MPQKSLAGRVEVRGLIPDVSAKSSCRNEIIHQVDGPSELAGIGST